MKADSNIASPFSTGGGGVNFETRVQSIFAVLLLVRGCAPGVPGWPVVKLKLQSKYAGYETDDCIVFAEEPEGKRTAKLFVSIKRSITFTLSDENFNEVIGAAWRDFSNKNVFARDLDGIALVTATLNRKDLGSVPDLLEWAKTSKTASEYFAKVNSKASSEDKIERLQIIRSTLDKCNGRPVSDEDSWQLLKHFHLLTSDLDRWFGFNRSLIETLLDSYTPGMSRQVWTQIVDFIQWENQNFGTISVESFPEEIVQYFRTRSPREIPQELVHAKHETKSAGLMTHYSADAALAMLVSSWNESVENDKSAVEKLSGESYLKWIKGLRSLALSAESPLRYKGGRWKVADRRRAWVSFGSGVYDDQLERFKEIAIDVLREPDPKFELPKEEHFAARLRGKVAAYSEDLKSGIAETLALLGSSPKALSSCSFGRAEGIAATCVRTILEDANWQIWATLNDQLPFLAEASPTVFMDAVEQELNASNGQLFRELFAQEGDGISGWNYMTGILWGLETLAWSDEYLGRSSLLLAQIAMIDPGGSWANRPIASLTNIFVPWLPHTAAPVEKRKAAVRAIVKDSKEIGWRLLKTMLPHSNQTVLGSRRPIYRDFIPQQILARVTGEDKRIPNEEYREQLMEYCGLAVEMAQENNEMLLELLRDLDDLPKHSFDLMLQFLGSDRILQQPEKDRAEIWEKLYGLVINHRKFADAKWALPEEAVGKIEAVAKELQPTSPLLIHRRLFGSHESDLYERTGDYDAQRRDLERRRTDAILDIVNSAGIEGVVNFADTVHLPLEVGLALGKNGNKSTDEHFLPARLTTEDGSIPQLTYGYVWTRFQASGWEWFEGIELTKWSHAEIASLLRALPFEEETWNRVDKLLAEDTGLYWKKVDARPYRLKQGLEVATRRLLAVQRPNAAIVCIKWMLYEKVLVPSELMYEALMSTSPLADDSTPFDVHEVVELIELLQGDINADKEQLMKVEWRHLELLDHDHGHEPRILETVLGQDSEFFCEVIRTVFRSELASDQPETEPDESKQSIVPHVFKLIWKWQTPPGLQKDSSFDAEQLRDWLTKVKAKCNETGHLHSALSQVGKALAHAPEDPDGLWIHKGAAQVLDEADASVMRSSFCSELFNMRGVYWGTKGQGERALAEAYRKKADDVERRGFFRLGAEIRRLAAGYDREAEREATEDRLEE